MEQLEGQIASGKVAMARFSSPQLYYILSCNDFSLDINDLKAPKILCVGNNPQKIQIYVAALSLYVNRLVKPVNKKGKLKSSLMFGDGGHAGFAVKDYGGKASEGIDAISGLIIHS